MAKVKLNPMFEELHGKLGDIVFRESYGETIMGRMPDLSGVVPTEAQTNQRDRFRQATVYGQMALGDAQARALYENAADQKGKPVFALIIGDFLNAPSIDEFDLSEYDGSLGSPIYIRTFDDFCVEGVQVIISDVSGNILDSGDAGIEPGGTGRWVYAAEAQVPAGTNVKIMIKVYDRPGNVTSKESTKAI